jgi:hypothetical protein
MLTYETSVVVCATGERLWSVLSGISRWSEWPPTITRIEASSRTPIERSPLNSCATAARSGRRSCVAFGIPWNVQPGTWFLAT